MIAEDGDPKIVVERDYGVPGVEANEKSTNRHSFSLPLPVTVKEKPVKSARIQRGGLRVHWARFKQRLGTSSALSESLLDGGAGSTDTSHSSRYRKTFQRRPTDQSFDGEPDEIDEVVVDQLGEKSSATPSEPATQEKDKVVPGSQSTPGTTESMAVTTYHDGSYGIWESCFLLTFLRWRLWPTVKLFFSPRFKNDRSEQQFRRETFITSKSLAFWSTLCFIANWIVVCAFAPRPFTLSDNIVYFGIGPLISFPLPFLVLYDIPYQNPTLYQAYLFITVWIWPIYQTSYMYACGFYSPDSDTCGNRDFISLFYYAIGLPFIALLGLHMTRLCDFLGAFIFIALNCGLTAPRDSNWTRNIINGVIAHGFILYIHWKKEGRERRLFSLRDQLKTQFRATQQAQINERRSSESKRKLTSYIFHEVRVPLNTALLAVQNLEATSTLAQEQIIEWTALQGSLATMSKVLNDILDFNRLDSGRFSTVQQPYNLHQAIQSLLGPLRLTADSRGLELHTELDPDIDEVARRSLYATQGRTQDWIEDELQTHPDEGGIVIGDEQRLRQVLTNLTNNACKFTQSGGSIKVVTKLVTPQVAACRPPPGSVKSSGITEIGETAPSVSDHSLSVARLDEHNSLNGHNFPPKKIVVRIEVHDTGVGIRPEDLVDHKLFSPYVQTEIGRYQGGKGSGLGLALVRRIVKRSGGRLGVKSKWGKGSQFWVELPLGVGEQPKDTSKPEGHSHNSDYSSEYIRDHPAAGFSRLNSNPLDALPAADDSSTFNVPRPATPGIRPTDLLRSVTEQSGGSELPQEDGLRGDQRPPTVVANEAPAASPLSCSEPPGVSELVGTNGTDHVQREQSVQDSSSVPPQSTSIPKQGIKGLKVLVVDDDDITRRLMSRMLTRLGCAVDTAENGSIAAEKILGAPFHLPQNDPLNPDPMFWRRSMASMQVTSTSTGERIYDIVFLDNQMPVMSGIEATTILRKLGRHDLLVGVTGNALLADQQEYLAAGVDRVLTKPVLERSLKEMLHVAAERRDQALNSQRQR